MAEVRKGTESLLDARDSIVSHLRQWASATVDVRGSEADKEMAHWMRKAADLLELDGAIRYMDEAMSE